MMSKWDNNWQFKNEWALLLFFPIKICVMGSIIPPLLLILELINNGYIPNYSIPFPFNQIYVMFTMLGLWALFSFIMTIKIMKKYKILIPITVQDEGKEV